MVGSGTARYGFWNSAGGIDLEESAEPAQQNARGPLLRSSRPLLPFGELAPVAHGRILGRPPA